MDKRLVYGLIGLAGVVVAAGVVTAVLVSNKKEKVTDVEEDVAEETAEA